SRLVPLLTAFVGAVGGGAAASGRLESVLRAETTPAHATVRVPAAPPAVPTAVCCDAGNPSPPPATRNPPVERPAPTARKKPNIVIIWGDDVGQSDISAYSMGLMGFKTPNIDRVAKEGVIFTDYYAEQSCTAGRSSFITGQCGLRTGNTKVGMPGAAQGLQ